MYRRYLGRCNGHIGSNSIMTESTCMNHELARRNQMLLPAVYVHCGCLQHVFGLLHDGATVRTPTSFHHSGFCPKGPSERTFIATICGSILSPFHGPYP